MRRDFAELVPTKGSKGTLRRKVTAGGAVAALGLLGAVGVAPAEASIPAAAVEATSTATPSAVAPLVLKLASAGPLADASHGSHSSHTSHSSHSSHHSGR